MRRSGAGTALAGTAGEEGEIMCRPLGAVKDEEGPDAMREE